MKILIVDDDPELLPLVAYALRQAGFLVLEATTGAQALELLKSERPDLAVLDLNLPGIDGFEVCKRVRKSASNQTTPVVMLTSNSSPADRIKGKLAGCDTYLIKPVREGVFEDVIRELVQPAAAA